MAERIDLSAWSPGGELPEVAGRSGQRGRWAPATDVSETPGQFLLEVDLPGVERKDLELTVAGRRLVLEGVRAPLETEGRVLLSERPSGSFTRELLLPREFPAGPQADYREGVLTIRFAKPGSPDMGVTGLPPGMASMAESWPLLDILDTGEGLTLLADLPGVSQEALDVLFEGQVLTLRGRREPETSGRRYRLVERPAGVFSRSILLPDGMEGDRIQASFKEGVLSVVLPAGGAALRPRKRVSSGGTSSADPGLREELEALRAQHQALRDEVDGFWLALGCGLRLVQIPLHQHLPVEVSLRDEDPIVQAQVMAAVRKFVEFAGFEVWRDLPREGGAFLKRWQVRTRRKESQPELQQRLLRVQEALELVRQGAMQAREPRPEDFQDAERERLLGEAARPWAEAIFALASAVRWAASGASLLIGALSLRKEVAPAGATWVLGTLGEEELASHVRTWLSAAQEKPPTPSGAP
ncbi:Hsp20/alpha crystallin family protein [Archangium gephyra]|uniref:Hsp20 family protein n=1 Tax=Archangium gephyra TaxID=48 RepID=UPI0035D4F7F0